MMRLMQIQEAIIEAKLSKSELLCSVADTKAASPEVSRILATIVQPGLSNVLGQSPASYAVMADDPKQLERLLSLGYKPFDREGSLLHGAAYWNSIRVAKYLLDHGADPNQINGGGATPLMVAVGEGGPDVARLLLARGATVDSKTVRFALVCKDQEMVNLLAGTGIQLDAVTRATAGRLHMRLPGDGL
jgi:ankyrin repeat protein